LHGAHDGDEPVDTTSLAYAAEELEEEICYFLNVVPCHEEGPHNSHAYAEFREVDNANFTDREDNNMLVSDTLSPSSMSDQDLESNIQQAYNSLCAKATIL
jgi:hypothetical protein